uniref:Uncharacterized protein n=1 Tax=Globisporangium ultimum (strain ATCC 200006 / CBS 805.95 / DAOM BR144) TaxID=431595 RepID=K3WMH9_GLOUD
IAPEQRKASDTHSEGSDDDDESEDVVFAENIQKAVNAAPTSSDKFSSSYTTTTSSASTHASDESSPLSAVEFVPDLSQDHRVSDNSAFGNQSSPGDLSYNRNTFDSGTPQGSFASSARDSYDDFVFESINDAKKTPEVPAEDPQYFDTDSERGSGVDNNLGNSSANNDQDDGDERQTYVNEGPAKTARKWSRPKLFNKLGSEKLAHVFEKRSSSVKSSSNSNSSSTSETDSQKPKTSAFAAVAAAASSAGAKLARRASNARTFSIGEGAPVPSNRLRKASSAASSQSAQSDYIDDDVEGSVVYSPTGQDTKSKSKKFSFFRSAPAAAPAGIAKRFGWKKNADKKKAGQAGDFDNDYAGLSLAA